MDFFVTISTSVQHLFLNVGESFLFPTELQDRNYLIEPVIILLTAKTLILVLRRSLQATHNT